MRVLVLAFLLTVSAAAGAPEGHPAEAIASPWARRTPLPEPRLTDPCAVARQIARQPACHADGDCEALSLWRRSFGPPRIEPLDPSPSALPADGAIRGLPRRPPDAVVRWPPGPAPETPRRLRPGFSCPAGTEPPR